MFHSFIKDSSKKILFILFFSTVGCSFNIKEDNLYEIYKVHCFSSYQKYFTGKFITSNDEIFISTIAKLKKYESIVGEYNLIVSAGSKSSSGYGMFYNKASIKNDLLSLYFDILKPESGSITLTVITHPMCLLYIQDINNFDIKINL